jgi:hypothetical protein
VSKKKVKVPNSLDRAIGSLKEMHEERLDEARAAEVKAEEDKKRAEETAAREAKEREEAAVRGKRADELGAEQKRVQAEREARAKAEAATAAERERLAAALEAERASKEADLAQEEKRRRFPKWAIGASIAAVLIVGGLAAFGAYQAQRSERANEELKAAIRRAEELDAKRVETAKQLEAATTRLAAAKDEAERKKAQEALDAIAAEAKRLDEEKAKQHAADQEKRKQICERAKAQVAQERKSGVKVSTEDTSSALGGMNEHGETKAEKQVRIFCAP